MRKGVVLLIVIIILVFMGTVLLLFTDVSNKIIFQTNRAFLEAAEQNMISSGIAWAKHNIEKGNIKETENEIQLDTAGIGVRDAQLAVTIEKISHKQAQLTVNTSCSLSGQSLKHTRKYQITLKH
ncbi:MAG: hypothetical protein ABSE89_11950 [Sedimentisphaerales bacterium]